MQVVKYATRAHGGISSFWCVVIVSKIILLHLNISLITVIIRIVLQQQQQILTLLSVISMLCHISSEGLQESSGGLNSNSRDAYEGTDHVLLLQLLDNTVEDTFRASLLCLHLHHSTA